MRGRPGGPSAREPSRNASGSGPGRRPSRIVGEKERSRPRFPRPRAQESPSPTPARRARRRRRRPVRGERTRARPAGRARVGLRAHHAQSDEPGRRHGSPRREPPSFVKRFRHFFHPSRKKRVRRKSAPRVNAGSPCAVVGAEGGTSAPPSPTSSPKRGVARRGMRAPRAPRRGAGGCEPAAPASSEHVSPSGSSRRLVAVGRLAEDGLRETRRTKSSARARRRAASRDATRETTASAVHGERDGDG